MGSGPVSAAELLDRATAAGVEIFLAGERVRVRAPVQPPADLLAELRRHKAELVALLDSKPRRYVYRFKLHGNEGGGTYITSGDLETARAALLKRYGDRLALVALA
jgi:hypothetical protein